MNDKRWHIRSMKRCPRAKADSSMRGKGMRHEIVLVQQQIVPSIFLERGKNQGKEINKKKHKERENQ